MTKISHQTQTQPDRTVGRRPRRGHPTPLLLIALLTFFGSPSISRPDPTPTTLGPAETTFGQGEFTLNTPQQTEYTQQSPQAIIEWGQDIQQPADHTLGFRQDSGFSVLNRSPGVRASNFFGTVSCDATCIFANEAGIHFRDGSQVDVGRLIAAGGRIENESFLSGVYDFQNLQGEVINRGFMRGQDITLLGQRVANFGHVDVPDGSFGMWAGRRIQLREHNNPIVIEGPLAPRQPEPGESAFGTQPLVDSAGTVNAEGGIVRLGAGDMLSFAIRHSGEIRAGEIAIQGGEDGLVEVTGALDVMKTDPAGTGGTIDVLGDYIVIGDGASIHASGDAGGGKIRIGGDRMGQGSTPTARGTFLHADAEVRADALTE